MIGCAAPPHRADVPWPAADGARGSQVRDGSSGSGGVPDRGSVTVEAAVALSALVMVLALCLAAMSAMVAQVRVTDAAGEAARLAARGDEEAAKRAVAELAPSGATLTLSGDDLVTARVSAVPVGGLLPGLRLVATAVAAREPE